MDREKIAVRITRDLTSYHPDFKVGAVGVIVRPRGMWARQQDRFSTVELPNGAWLDVLHSSFERVGSDESGEIR